MAHLSADWCDNAAMPEWSEEEFQERVERRAEELGRTVPDVLREARLSHDYLKKKPQSGRRIDILQRIARCLEWSLSDLLGWEVPSREGPVDIQQLTRALMIADMVIGDNLPQGTPERRSDLAQIAGRVYEVLIERAAAGFATSDNGDLELIASIWRRFGPR